MNKGIIGEFDKAGMWSASGWVKKKSGNSNSIKYNTTVDSNRNKNTQQYMYKY